MQNTASHVTPLHHGMLKLVFVKKKKKVVVLQSISNVCRAGKKSQTFNDYSLNVRICCYVLLSYMIVN